MAKKGEKYRSVEARSMPALKKEFMFFVEGCRWILVTLKSSSVEIQPNSAKAILKCLMWKKFIWLVPTSKSTRLCLTFTMRLLNGSIRFLSGQGGVKSEVPIQMFAWNLLNSKIHFISMATIRAKHQVSKRSLLKAQFTNWNWGNTTPLILYSRLLPPNSQFISKHKQKLRALIGRFEICAEKQQSKQKISFWKRVL